MTKVYPSFVTPSRAAEIFDVTTQTLRRWAKEGKISFIKTPGGQYRYNVEGHIGLMQAAPEVKVPKAHPVKAKPVTVKPAPAPSVVVSGGSGGGASVVGMGGTGIPAPVEISLPQAKPRPQMPEGVELRSIDDDEPEITTRDIDAPRARPAAKVKPAPVTGPKLDAAALMQKIEGLATASAV